jgi:Mitochondrial carrier protein
MSKSDVHSLIDEEKEAIHTLAPTKHDLELLEAERLRKAAEEDARIAKAKADAEAKAVVAKKSHGHLLFLQTVAGAASGAFTKTATAPLERIKIIFQIQGMAKGDLVKPKYTGIMQTMVLVTKEEGPLALWKGNGANVLRVIPVYGLKFAFNDTFKSMVAGPTKKKLTTSELLWVGTLAGLFQTILTYPLETVRTRLSLGAEQGGVHYKGIGDCFKQMVKTEGVSGL